MRKQKRNLSRFEELYRLKVDVQQEEKDVFVFVKLVEKRWLKTKEEELGMEDC